jgi:hypothetical protein
MGDYTNLSIRLDIGTSLLPTPSVSVPPVIVSACKAVKKAVTTAANKAVKNLPLSKKNKTKLRDAIVKKVMGSIDCKNPGNIPSKVAKALVSILKGGGLGLPHIPLPTHLPGLPGGTGGLGGLGGVGPLGRAGTSIDPSTADIFNGPAGDVDQLGYNSTLGSLLLQGVKG